MNMFIVKVTSHCKELYEMYMAVDLDISSRSGSEKHQGDRKSVV